MAITIDDFSKIWASTSPLTPYEFSENNYKQGWDFVGGTPPSRQMWDFLQKQNDEKLKYLLDNFDNYLPLSGGTVTGNILLGNGALILKDSLDDDLALFGDNGPTPAPLISIRGRNRAQEAGCFLLRASDGTNIAELNGKPDGTLTWNGLEVALYKESGYGYLIISNSTNTHGVQICWGAAQNATSAGITVTFGKAFPADSTVRVLLTPSVNSTAWVTDITTTNFKAYSATTAWARYIAIANY